MSNDANQGEPERGGNGRATLVFDLDGTLIDSLGDIIASFRHAFATFELPAPADRELRAQLGGPLEQIFARFAPAERVAELAACYRAHYAEHFTDTTRPYPGVDELLRELRRRGYLLAVATTKRSAPARKLVAELGLAPYLDLVQGTDGFPHKPAPDVIQRALAAVGGHGLWMVGDSAGDIQAGRAAGLATYGVTWGAHDADTLQAAGADTVAPSLSVLLELV